ncbi:MAG: hypothetical protein QM688_03660, partial [Sphingomonas bacterium]
MKSVAASGIPDSAYPGVTFDIAFFLQFTCFGAGVGDKAALLFCPHAFKGGQFVVGRAGWHDDARRRGAAMSRDEAGDGLFVGFIAGLDFNNVGHDGGTTPFKPCDATGKRTGHVMPTALQAPQA